jgi:hypothetical protein
MFCDDILKTNVQNYYYAPVSNRLSSAMIKPQTDKRVQIVKPENTIQSTVVQYNVYCFVLD